MLEAGEENGVIRIRASGTLESADFDRFVPLFERIAAREPRSVPMLIELARDFSGWDLGGLWRDLKFDVKHQDKFGRIAIVGEKTWQEWGTKLSDPFFPSADMRFFDPDESDTAAAWARTGREANAT
tara:strand:+ start:85 stop:465 length:381 start_codon:yes stop_codon:yes gene_type:complete